MIRYLQLSITNKTVPFLHFLCVMVLRSWRPFLIPPLLKTSTHACNNEKFVAYNSRSPAKPIYSSAFSSRAVLPSSTALLTLPSHQPQYTPITVNNSLRKTLNQHLRVSSTSLSSRSCWFVFITIINIITTHSTKLRKY